MTLSKDGIVFSILNAVGTYAVPFFVMLTGYLMVDRKYNKEYIQRFVRHNVFPMLVAYEVWVIVFSLVDSHGILNADSLVTLIKALFFIGQAPGFLWFLQMMIGLYIGLPFLSYAISLIRKNHVESYALSVILVALFFISLVPTISDFLTLANVNLVPRLDTSLLGASEWGIYLILGYLLKSGFMDIIHTGILGFLFCISMVGAAFYRGARYSFLFNQAETGTYAMFFTVVGAFFGMALIIRVCNSREGYVNSAERRNVFANYVKRVIEFVSKISFGIFIIHKIVLSGFSY